MADKCGSSECMDVIDKMGQRLSMSLMTSQQDGFKSIRDLMEQHHKYLEGRIDEFKRAVEKDNQDLWPRLRASESNIKVIENILTPDLESKIKKVVLNSEELESKIRKVSADNLDVRSMKSWRRTALEIFAMIIGTVIAALILTHYTISRDKPEQPSSSHRTQVEVDKK
jgi:hypothetical protein